MNCKHCKTVEAIFNNPVNGNIKWSRIEALLVAVGCVVVVEGAGSSVTFEKMGKRAYFHRHPQKESLRYRVSDARYFLEAIGVKP